MSTPILTTKLYIPPPRPALVARPRLIERLNERLRQNQGFGRKLTLIAAPAGSGKTTLVSEWLNNLRFASDDLRLDVATESQIVNRKSKIQSQVAWLSLDEGDNDLPRFLTYFVAALQTIDADLGTGVLSLLQSPQPPPAELILTSLINEIAEAAQSVILILDDYHVIETRPIHDALTFLLDRLPPQMHLAIASRADPPLPLARLRGRGELTELRAADLRFTPDEAATFLNQMMGLDLSASDVAALESRTEGWIVGLQMAALSMQGRADAATFIQAFTGSHRFVIDYLVEEVLQRQPEWLQNFLLQTAILNRLSGPLCDAVVRRLEIGDIVPSGYWSLENDDQATDNLQLPITNLQSQDVLEHLERANLFLVPLDDQRHWYRYHHLFADVLQARLREEQPDQVAGLHRRASAWYEQNDSPSEAIHHAFAARDFERAARLVELAWPVIQKGLPPATWLGWVKALPDKLVRARPVLSAGYAWILLLTAEFEAAGDYLRVAERWLDAGPDGSEPPEELPGETHPEMLPELDEGSGRRMVVANEEEFRLLPATIAIARTLHAQAFGDGVGAAKYARRALDLLPADDYFRRAFPEGILGLAYWASGDLEAAYHSLTNARVSMQMTGDIAAAISGTPILASIRVAQGRLHEAVSLYEQSLQVAAAQGEPPIQGTADLYLGLSELYLEQGNLEAATQQLLRSEALRERAANDAYQYRWRVVRARLKEVQGDPDGALALLDDAERVYTRGIVPDVWPVAALKARVWTAQGRLADARTWMHNQNLSVEDDLSYLHEFEHITLVRLLIAQYRNDGVNSAIQQAAELLERLLRAAEEGERIGSVIEILVLQALAHQAQDNIPAALVPLERALTLAEPEGYVQIFVNEGPPMVQLLYETVTGGITSDYAGKLLVAFEAGESASAAESPRPTAPSPQPLIEPLSQRELDVLRLFKTELSGPEIARELMIALSTVRTHTKNIYSKLNVNNRRAAVNRATELGLI